MYGLKKSRNATQDNARHRTAPHGAVIISLPRRQPRSASYLENGDPGEPDVVEGNRTLEGIGGAGAAVSIVRVPVDTGRRRRRRRGEIERRVVGEVADVEAEERL